MLISVTGLFKEIDGKKDPIRFFNRTFVIVPAGAGYCIRNEQLHIGQPSIEQEKKAFTTQISQPSTSSTSSSVSSPPTEINENAKRQMVLTLSQQTNMNLEWSSKCLQEVQWNFDTALTAFQQCFKEGKIPAEAFVK